MISWFYTYTYEKQTPRIRWEVFDLQVTSLFSASDMQKTVLSVMKIQRCISIAQEAHN